MKIDKVYINKEGAPMVSRKGWPELDISHAGSSGEAEGIRLEWVKSMEQAKREAVPIFGLSQRYNRNPDSFIEVDIKMEFVRQRRLIGSDTWCYGDPENIEHLDSYTCEVRTVARVVPEKAEEPLPDITLSGVNTRQSLFNYMHEQHGVTLLESDVDEIQNILVDVTLTAQQINDECQKHNDELVKQLAAAQERVKELETESKVYEMGDKKHRDK